MPDLNRREFLARTGALAAAAALPSVPAAKAAVEATTPVLGSATSLVRGPSGGRLFALFCRHSDGALIGRCEGVERKPGCYSFTAPVEAFQESAQVSAIYYRESADAPVPIAYSSRIWL